MVLFSYDCVNSMQDTRKTESVRLRKVLAGQIFHSCLTESISSTSPFFFFSCPFLFSLTLVTDDKAAFPAKPINKLNREKMSI